MDRERERERESWGHVITQIICSIGILYQDHDIDNSLYNVPIMLRFKLLLCAGPPKLYLLNSQGNIICLSSA